jgi:hypothetical protein
MATLAAGMPRRTEQPRSVVIGVEADRLELQAWGRAAAIRRQDLPRWIQATLTEAAERDEQRSSPRSHAGSRPNDAG